MNFTDDFTNANLRNRSFNYQNDSPEELDTNAWRQDSPPLIEEPTLPQRRKKSEPTLLSEIASDGWTLTKITIKMLRGSYSWWRYLVLFYIAWLLLTNLVAQLTTAISKTITNTLCPIPFVGSRIPLCISTPKVTRIINPSKVIKPQEELSKVMDTVGRGFDLARDMVHHEYAVRDLRIRVSASTLPRKEELSKELQTLVRQTKEAARGLSRFTAKVSKSVDMAKAFDQHAIKALEDIAKWEATHSVLSVSDRILSAIMQPLGAFSSRRETTEDKVKEVFLLTATKIGDKVHMLMEESWTLNHNLEKVHETLDTIKEIAVGGFGELPHHNVLGALWMSLAHPDDHAKLKTHKDLLVDMTNFYKKSSEVMEKTTAALNRIDAELGEFRDDFATPGLIMRDNSLDIIIDMLRLSAVRLEAGNLNLRRVEEGGRPGRVAGEPIRATVIGNVV
ncbi:hypothetical protein QBC38DRAFT_483122 [Podospora fimiseda]|uniref:Uncharacterized protein n=1 Tax=Podospora fimiseda TaxID=252190 RepID=A0AAN7GYY6_9PEZI|nr:hypothetical protein QBC38DRAFT_483122 [Podospora fimiseda]